jgi:[protein-PII] uridylyltransferase
MVAQGSLRDRRALLLAQQGLQGDEFCQAYAAEADAWLSELAEKAAGDQARHLALLAVGGYGRSSLCPYSDLDVVLVHNGHRDIKSVADAIWYPVWDEGVHLDHSVRRPAEVLTAAAADARVALGLLDGRLVWGEQKVAEPLLAKAREAWRDRLGTQYLPTLEAQMRERRNSAGDVAFLLEPDLKESHGGLRDVNVLRAISVYAPLLADYANLASLTESASVLTRVRVELHRMAQREQDKLLLQDQDQVAVALAFEDADALMAAVSGAGRQIAWVSDDVWRRRRLWDPTPATRRRFRKGQADQPDPSATAQPTDQDLVNVEGEIALAPIAAVSEDTTLAFRLAAAAAEMDQPIAKGSLHRLADRMPPPPDPWPPGVLAALVRMLAAGRPAIDKAESLDQHGLLVRLIPEWAAVRNKPQRNAYHTFTVDRHLLEAAAIASTLTDRVERPDLLLVGALLHDIGKGFPGDHTNVGMDIVRRMATRMGFVQADVEILVDLVRHHLLLPDTATRRDLDDPTTITRVAQAAGDAVTLHLLGALTEADSRATGPSAWGSWKAGLVADLVKRADRVLSAERSSGPGEHGDVVTSASDGGGSGNAGEATVGQGGTANRTSGQTHASLMDAVRASGHPEVHLDPPQVIVAAPDRPGLLSSVAGALALHGMDVRAANVSGEDGVAVEVFTVEVAHGTWPDTARLRRDLAAVLDDQGTIAQRLNEREQLYPARRKRQAAHLPPTDVQVDNEASAISTVLEVRAPDEVGLLHHITRSLFEADLDVVSARVSTLGELVVDAFYIRESTGEKVTDPDRLAGITATIRALLTP